MSDDFCEFRHIHYKHPERNSPKVANLKSITFAFSVDQVKEEIEIAWAICSACDVFSRKTGRELAWSRLIEGEGIRGQYLRCYDLVQNALIHLANEACKKETGADESHRLLGIVDSVLQINHYNRCYDAGHDYCNAEPGSDIIQQIVDATRIFCKYQTKR